VPGATPPEIPPQFVPWPDAWATSYGSVVPSPHERLAKPRNSLTRQSSFERSGALIVPQSPKCPFQNRMPVSRMATAVPSPTWPSPCQISDPM